jgi:DNA-binding SARP family transcriptional activator
MTPHRKPHAFSRIKVDDNTPNSARTDLTEAVTELRRLAQDPLLDRAERALAELGNAPSGSDVSVETVRRLRQWGAEYLRVASELEAAARYCRLVEREIGERIDVLPADWEGGLHKARSRDSGAPSASARGRPDLGRWLRGIFHRGHRVGSQRSEARPKPVSPEHAPLPPPLSAAPLGGYPTPIVPLADIATLALGPLEVHVRGRRVPRWNSLKARAVFQYLLIHLDRPTRRDVLMALQWPEHSHNSARNNLNVALYSLRNTLDGLGQSVQPILYRDGCYILNPELTWWIDRNEFLSVLDYARLARRTDRTERAIDAYEKATQLYRGALFEDDVAGEWYLPERRHLKELYLQALEQLAEIYFDFGDLPDAVRFAQLGTSSDPCCEPIHRMLMRCYASQNQQQLVSRQYRLCVNALHDELDVPPADETVQLFRKLTSAS